MGMRWERMSQGEGGREKARAGDEKSLVFVSGGEGRDGRRGDREEGSGGP